jgi:hypothetical protein
VQGQFQLQAQSKNQPQSQLQRLIYPTLLIYFLLQLWLPIRHHFIAGDVFKTEEGHRMAWRMMLRSKYGTAKFRVVDKESGKNWVVSPNQYLTTKQAYRMGGRPDMIWQFAQYLQQQYAEQDTVNIEIYADASANLNGENYILIDPEVDLLAVQWKRFGHNPWIVAGN